MSEHEQQEPVDLDRPIQITGCVIDPGTGRVVDAGQMLLVPGHGMWVFHGPDGASSSQYAPQVVHLLTVPNPGAN